MVTDNLSLHGLGGLRNTLIYVGPLGFCIAQKSAWGSIDLSRERAGTTTIIVPKTDRGGKSRVMRLRCLKVAGQQKDFRTKGLNIDPAWNGPGIRIPEQHTPNCRIHAQP